VVKVHALLPIASTGSEALGRWASMASGRDASCEYGLIATGMGKAFIHLMA
jgi:hypothetical protein